jgi:hypothetical protein
MTSCAKSRIRLDIGILLTLAFILDCLEISSIGQASEVDTGVLDLGIPELTAQFK